MRYLKSHLAHVKSLRQLLAHLMQKRNENPNLNNFYTPRINIMRREIEKAIRVGRTNIVNGLVRTPAFINQNERFKKRQRVLAAAVKHEKNIARLSNSIRRVFRRKGIPENQMANALKKGLIAGHAESIMPRPGNNRRAGFANATAPIRQKIIWGWVPIRKNNQAT